MDSPCANFLNNIAAVTEKDIGECDLDCSDDKENNPIPISKTRQVQIDKIIEFVKGKWIIEIIEIVSSISYNRTQRAVNWKSRFWQPLGWIDQRFEYARATNKYNEKVETDLVHI